MKITIIVDGLVAVDGKAKVLHGFDWSPWADVHAVQADLARDRAEVEYRTIDPDGDGPLPAVKPPNEIIDKAAFIERFGALLQAYLDAPEETAPQTAPAERAAVQASAVDPSLMARLDALEAMLAHLEAIAVRHQEGFERIYKVLPGAET